MRGLLLACLLLGCGGPSPLAGHDGGTDASARDAGRDAFAPLRLDAGPDTSCPIVDPGPAFYCFDGQILETQCTPWPCPSCVRIARPDVVCARGCIDGASTSVDPYALCRALPRVGDSCTTDADCAPAEPDDGYGGPPEPVTLHCDAAHHACASDHEACDGQDDDLDGATDEGCACVARASVLTSVSGIPGDAAFGGGRILLSTWSDLGSALELTDAEGVHVGSSGLAQGVQTPSRIAGGFLYADLNTTGATAIRRLRDDATGGTIALAPRMSALHYPYVTSWGADFLVLDPTDTPGSWSLARVNSASSVVTTGALLAGTTLRLTELLDGTPLVIDLAGAAPIRAIAIDSDGSTREAAGSSDRVGPSSEIAVTTDRVWVPGHDASGAVVLSAIDRATGEWAETISLGVITMAPDFFGPSWASVHLAARGDHLFASWPDAHERVRVLVLDTSGTRLGEVTIALPSRTPFQTGTTDAGVRIVAGPTLYAPCDAL